MKEEKEREKEGVKERPAKKDTELVEKTSQILKLMEQLGQMSACAETGVSETPREHKFWKTQPVVQCFPEAVDCKDGPISTENSIELVKAEPYALPPEFTWSVLDIDIIEQRNELYQLLNQNYVEDIESLFRFNYPPQFLDWALKPPNWERDWHVGVRVVQSGKLVAFISAIPTVFGVRQANINAVEVNFLCIHKKLRYKRLAPVLIKEITRRVNLQGTFQALYTAGTVLPGLLSKARYFHRPLNFKKLVEIGFTAVPLGKTLSQMILRYHLAKEHHLGSSFRPMKLEDVSQVCLLLSAYLSKFPLHAKLIETEIRHWLLPRAGIVHSFVVEGEQGKVTDFISFYSLPSTVVDNKLHSQINVAYLFYYASPSPDSLESLVHAALLIARDLGFDVFNCVEIMENSMFLNSLKFGEGDGSLNYYLYNWKTKALEPGEIAVVML